ncbi:hypothetical protein ACH5RR_036016 [Cinchona calisaya]|uniref:Glycosyltransferase n=1 Tax=Cinchona calisaya TaxID=153742 RepID=A0ABD2Y1Z6_9GENT
MPTSKSGLHVLVFPFPAQGHMLPVLDFTHQLAQHGFAITILVTPKNLPILNPLLSAHSSIQTLVFPFPHHPSIPCGAENVKDIGNHGTGPIIGALSKLNDQLIQWFKAHHSPPDVILSDFFLGWTQDMAHQIGIPRIAFYTSGAFITSVFYHLWQNIESLVSKNVVNFVDLPKSPSFIWDHLPSVFRRYRKSDPDWEIVKNGMIANMSSWGSIFNTFDALEEEYLQYLKKIMGHDRIFAVGPINLMGSPDRMGPCGSSTDTNQRVVKWLDGCPDRSVLYVCFGSQKSLSEAQMEALAAGLEQSGVRFIWVVMSTAQQMAQGCRFVLDGFEDRVSGKGIVIKGWAPQVSTLSHWAVGGILCHCGWNSVLEAMVAGVKILGWPMEAEQFVNARLLVDYLGAAFRICEGVDTVPDPIELACKISQSMRKDTIEMVRARELQDKALSTIKVGGSSKKNMDRLVKELAQLQGH